MHVLAVSRFIEGALQEGFTTVRDAGGLEPTWAHAVGSGALRGPRILPSASPISQTGGHADDRQRHEAIHASQTIPGLVAGMVVADGADEVRKAAREQLRRGATQIKLMASGGIISPDRPLRFAAALGGGDRGRGGGGARLGYLRHGALPHQPVGGDGARCGCSLHRARIAAGTRDGRAHGGRGRLHGAHAPDDGVRSWPIPIGWDWPPRRWRS